MIQTKYTVEAEDFLAFQLFNASLSKRLKVRRWVAWLSIPIIYSVLAYSIYSPYTLVLFWIVIIVGVFWLAGYPFYSKWRYKRYYTRYVNDTHKNNFGKEVVLKIDDTHIQMSDTDGSEGRMKIEQIEAIYELESHLFIKLKNGQTIILPKARMIDFETFYPQIKQATIDLGLIWNSANMSKWL